MAQISDEINKYLKGITDNLAVAQKEVRKIITVEAYKVFENIKNNTPLNNGDLRSGIYIVPLKGMNTDQTKERGRDYWGYKIGFDGETSNGMSRESLAKILNYGHGDYTKNGKHFGAITGTHFISKELSKLKTLDKKIQNKLDKLVQEGKID